MDYSTAYRAALQGDEAFKVQASVMLPYIANVGGKWLMRTRSTKEP